MRLVLDCNILISAGQTEGVCRMVVTEAIEHHQIVLSDAILKEYRTVALRPKFAAYRDDTLRIIDLVESVATAASLAEAPVLRDRSDEIYLAAALGGNADVLVTGNIRHFPEPAYGSVRVMTPRRFLDSVPAR